jgi:hypothetical protein
MAGNWKRITFDPRTDRGGYRYHCVHGHSWFMTFDKLRELGETDAPNDCPDCRGQESETAPSE